MFPTPAYVSVRDNHSYVRSAVDASRKRLEHRTALCCCRSLRRNRLRRRARTRRSFCRAHLVLIGTVHEIPISSRSQARCARVRYSGAAVGRSSFLSVLLPILSTTYVIRYLQGGRGGRSYRRADSVCGPLNASGVAVRNDPRARGKRGGAARAGSCYWCSPPRRRCTTPWCVAHPPTCAPIIPT